MLTTRQAALLRSLPRDGAFNITAVTLPNSGREWGDMKRMKLMRRVQGYFAEYKLTPEGQAAWDALQKEQCDGER